MTYSPFNLLFQSRFKKYPLAIYAHIFRCLWFTQNATGVLRKTTFATQPFLSLNRFQIKVKSVNCRTVYTHSPPLPSLSLSLALGHYPPILLFGYQRLGKSQGPFIISETIKTFITMLNNFYPKSFYLNVMKLNLKS